jgi:ATP-dependent RNA helicase CshB
VEAKPFDYRRPRPQPDPDPEVLKITTRPVKQVKPGYRKKRAQAVEKVQRRRRREFIRTKIKEEQKERAKAAQRARRKDQ